MAIEAGTSTYYQAKRGIVQDGLVLHLDAGVKESYSGGTTWRDLGLSKKNASLINGPLFTKERGGGIVFDGVNDKVQVSNFFLNPDDFTISSFYMSDFTYGAPSRRPIFGMYFSLSSVLNIIWLGPAYNHQYIEATVAYNYPAGSTNTINRQTHIGGSYKKTNHLAMSYSFSSKTLKLYRNGSLINSGTNNNMFAHNAIPTSTFQLGEYNGTTGILFHGNMYNFSVYNRQISDNEVAQIYNATRHRFGL